MRISDWSSDVCSSDLLAHLREQRRDLLHARGGRLQPFGHRCELARHQAVDRAAGQAVVGLRVPGPGLQRLDVPDVALDLVVQDQRVDLVLARERGGVDGVEPGEDRLVEIDSRLAARSEEHTSELQSIMRISYAGFCLKKKT